MSSAVLARTSSNLQLDRKLSLVNPLVDFFFLCGGLMWCLFLLHQMLPAAGGGQSSFGAAALTVSVMLAEAHVMATLVRLYECKMVRQKHAGFVIISPLIILLSVSILCMSKEALSAITLGYLFASIHHGLRQCYGITLLYCMRAGFKLTNTERKILSYFLHTATLFAACRQLAFQEFFKSPLRGIELNMFQIFPAEAITFLGAVCSILGLLLLSMLGRQRQDSANFPPLALFLIINSILVVVFSREIAGDLWIFVPGFFHGAQYLGVTVVHRIGKIRENRATGELSTAISQYLFMLLVFSFLVYGLFPIVLQHFGVSFYTATAAVFLSFVLHHFWADALIWRLKDPSLVRAFQLGFHRSMPCNSAIVPLKESSQCFQSQ
jgi:hypothetical protein